MNRASFAAAFAALAPRAIVARARNGRSSMRTPIRPAIPALVVAALGALAGCSDDDVDPQAALVARGEYLVEHVSACGDCHTPRTMTGQLDRTRWLAGVPDFADLDPGDTAVGSVGAPNLTPHATGLAGWTDAQIKNAIKNGRDATNGPLFPIMPYWVYHNMLESDADAIVAYLRTVAPQNNTIPDRQPLPFPFTMPATPIPANSIPNTTLSPTDSRYSAAVRGRYLAGMAGVCIDCHTPEAQGATPAALDSLYAGGRSFGPGVRSANITPHASGIANLTVAQIRTILKLGVDEGGMPICPPMPVGPLGAYGGLTDADAEAIAEYIKSIPPIAHTVPDCVP
jgi:mono/diheme cytochrome c family protein